jgi:hypothetical protein
MLGRECPEAVLPDRALYVTTFRHWLIVNKLLSRARARALRGTSRGDTCSRRVKVLLDLRHNTTQRSGLRLLHACRLFLVRAKCRRGLLGWRRWGHGGSAREKAPFRTDGGPRAGITAKETGTARAQATECSASQVADDPEESEDEGKPNGCHGAWYERSCENKNLACHTATPWISRYGVLFCTP